MILNNTFIIFDSLTVDVCIFNLTVSNGWVNIEETTPEIDPEIASRRKGDKYKILRYRRVVL